ncbi:Pyroglutamylated RFamide peptide receptor [Pteropus alecto]|uniref:Pyroglutamylated RFamide peptide receptor n=1 Tax=Pteropus alecto TaxID=9402 RepID=L5KAT8_PTEAL|nr:Pyroglutamylated RFamide peptide receptor [Pteropus alecto]
MAGSPNRVVLILKIKYDFSHEKEHVCLEEQASPAQRKSCTAFTPLIPFLRPLLVMLGLRSNIAYALWINERVGDVARCFEPFTEKKCRK